MRQNTQKTVAVYARVSTLEQDCALQLDDLRRFAEQRFGERHEYVEVGVSGAQRRRPQLDALMADARRRRFDVVLVWKFDRFARSVKHLVDSLEEFQALGIDFISYTEGVDTTTPTGQLLFHIVGAVAQFERDLIAERVRAGIAHARAMGKHIGRPRAPIDAKAVEALRTQGHSLRQIAKTLSVPVSRVRRALASRVIPQREATGQQVGNAYTPHPA
ncbi:MAG: recombinase family protein [Acidobacteria bacterium]|nr:recombinase family protein [Acidobacteriota bacterium]